jgi:AraC family transcriptional regulator
MAETLRSAGMPDLPDLANLDYVARVNRAIDHVTRHLAEPLQLEDVAQLAAFSPFHFHRIFRSLVGETLHAFVKRVRLERAVYLMSHRDASLTDIALSCGFASSSDFSRSFRSHYGVPPSVFDVEKFRSERRDQMIDALVQIDRIRLERLPGGENPDGFAVRIREVPARRVAYVRVLQPYKGGVPAAAARMIDWAKRRGLDGQWLGYQWDDPEIVPLELCRYDIGLEIAPPVAVDEEVSVVEFPTMKLAEIELDGTIDLEMRAIDWIYRTWLPNSPYVPDHQPMFEAWSGLPFEHGYERFVLRLQLAVTAP